MSLLTAQGSISVPGSTGNASVTGMGFQPTLILFFFNLQTASGASANASFGLGACDASLNQWTEGTASEDAQTTTVTGSNASIVSAIRHDSYNQTVQYEGRVASMDAGGFTINWTTVTLTGAKVYYLAFGGTDLQATVGNTTSPTVTGNVAVTSSLGFTPTAVLVANDRGGATNTAVHSYFGLGAAMSSSVQWSVFGADQSATTSLKGSGYQRTASVIDTQSSGGSTPIDTATFASMDANGFTVNSTVNSGASVNWKWLALSGINFAMGAITQKTTTGTQATSGLGFQPSALMLISDNRVASTSASTPMNMCIGMANASSSAGLWTGSTYASTSSCSVVSSTSNIYQYYTPSGASPTLVAAASLNSLDTNGFTLNFGTADATARQILYFAWGALGAGGPTSSNAFFLAA